MEVEKSTNTQASETVQETTPASVSALERNVETNAPRPRMDGGRDAWLAILGCWMLMFNSWGLSNAFGVFQTYYSTEIIPESNSNAIAWIGSIQSFLTGLTGVGGGWLLDSGLHRPVLITGATLEVFGMFMTSIGSKYWHFLLSQGICVGLGSGLLAVSSPTILALYFEKRRLLAGGIASTGAGVSGTIFPLVMRRLFVKAGFGWAVRILAFIMLFTLCIALLVIKPRKAPKKRTGPLIRGRWIKDPVYVCFVIGFAFINAGLYVPSFFIEDYALGLGVEANMAFYILSILNATTTVCRVLPNWLADEYGAINILIPCTLATTLVAFLWPLTSGLGDLIAICVGWSIATGALISLPPLGIANLTSDPSEYGSRIGLGYTVAAFGALLGNPIAGAARGDKWDGMNKAAVKREFRSVWFVAAVALAVASILLLAVRWMLVGARLRKKV